MEWSYKKASVCKSEIGKTTDASLKSQCSVDIGNFYCVCVCVCVCVAKDKSYIQLERHDALSSSTISSCRLSLWI